ncbi:methylmalonyl-CoA mutase family protein [Mycobacterium kansasii]|uniref:methylmalonyl-CoA mutase n=1 Tax=Mycobacterium kansasii TaxID=1768 RepID=A0A1V3XEU5_MYCKA|nr:methylmalonyl-CoA mutase family protein [Mycobacterium kansasii]
MTLAKMRAARQLWARVAEVAGDPDGGAVTVHAETSLPMMTQRDPWVNMLRCTLAAFGAGVGGADTVLVHPFDVAIPGGFPGTPNSFARRIARNTQLLLLEESHVGRVLDPAGGSWFVEDLTEQLAQEAWRHFQAIEAHGGFVAAHDYLAGRIAEVAARRTDDIAHRRLAITGVNEFPNLDEPRCRRVICPAPAETWCAMRRGSKHCATARTAFWPAPAHDRRCCCCRWVRWPSTTPARRSRPTCWPPVASRRSTPEQSTRPVWQTSWQQWWRRRGRRRWQ